MNKEQEPSEHINTGTWLAEIDNLKNYWDGKIGIRTVPNSTETIWSDNPADHDDGVAYTREKNLIDAMWQTLERGGLSDQDKTVLLKNISTAQFEDPNAQEHLEEFRAALEK